MRIPPRDRRIVAEQKQGEMARLSRDAQRKSTDAGGLVVHWRSLASPRSLGRAAACVAGLLVPCTLGAREPSPLESPSASEPASSPTEPTRPTPTSAPEAAIQPTPMSPPEATIQSNSEPSTQTAAARSGAADHTEPVQFDAPHYEQGFVLVSPLNPERTPYRLKLNHVSQFKYTNSLAVNDTYTDHLGREKEVQKRHDIQLTRDVFYFSGFVFDPKLDFNVLIYTSTATLTATAAGYVGYRFSKAFALRTGFFSLPSVRSLTGTFPYFHGTDRSMANNYMRGGFTPGIWADGEPLPGFKYIAMIGNSLNTLDIKAANIDKTFAAGVSVWYDLNEFGNAWNDYEHHSQPALRIGTAFTFAREDRLSDLSTASPENNSTFVSDGNLLFETGALAPDVTLELANFYLWAVDAGIKYRGLAFNAEVYQRVLNNFNADGPLPLDSLHDWGFEASLGYFVLQSRLEAFARTSLVKGDFGTGVEGAVGFHWYPFDTRNVWLDSEAIWIKDSPYGSAYYVYSVGQTGFLLPVQFMLRF
jgi:hypothetical protein